jgi:hypothetical protein
MQAGALQADDSCPVLPSGDIGNEGHCPGHIHSGANPVHKSIGNQFWVTPGNAHQHTRYATDRSTTNQQEAATITLRHKTCWQVDYEAGDAEGPHNHTYHGRSHAKLSGIEGQHWPNDTLAKRNECRSEKKKWDISVG